LTSPDCCGNDCASRMRESRARSCALVQRASAADPLIAVAPAPAPGEILTLMSSRLPVFIAPSPPGQPVITSLRL
jgi:hypothetical protein